MPKLKCRCENVIDLSPVPCPNERFLIGSMEMEKVFDALDENASSAETILETQTQSVIVCDRCGRFYLSKSDDSNEYAVLVPEAAATNDVTEAND